MNAVKPPHSAVGRLLPRSRGRMDETDGAHGATNARQILLQGRVQGLGVRPAIARLALRLRLNGSVTNTSEGVLIYLEGLDSAIDGFQSLLADEMPSLASFQISRIIDVPVAGHQDFRILAQSKACVTAVDVPVDLAMCSECARELIDQTNRRYAYAFSSCTVCGPRYSIIRAMPYERSDTAMVAFALCPYCDTEYHNREDRRFHAQTVACPDCGPRLWFESMTTSHDCTGQDAIAAATEILRTGGILALKGLGGYQLLCDATNAAAVQRLREKKQRPSKPLAVMIRYTTSPFSSAPGEKMADRPDEGAFVSPSNPIVIVQKANLNLDSVASNVSPGMNSLGVMLPTTPLHALLVNELKTPLVVTSGNRDSEPLAYEDTSARKNLEGIADGWLNHNRVIERPIDDSVVRIIAGRTVTIRAGRGIAPLRLPFQTHHTILAVGGEQKVACAVSNGLQVVLGPHLGDMSTLAGRQRFVEQASALQDLYGAKPAVVAHDLHPDYFTSRWAADRGLRTIAIQHHHAHIVSGMLQHGLLDQQVLGVAFDGTGYGSDGTIWGGEFLLTTKTCFQRVGSLRPFVLPGGDAAIREPWRVAVSLLNAAIPEITAEQIDKLLRHQAATSKDFYCMDRDTLPTLVQIRHVQRLVSSEVSPVTSSMGRLFDGVASMLLGIGNSGFEGEPAMRLEADCDETSDYSANPLTCCLSESMETAVLHVDWRPVVRQVFRAIQTGVPASVTSMRFHRAIARAVGMVAERFPDYSVVLSGGCFQNRILTELTIRELDQKSRMVASPGTIPPNDGGLAAGQIAIAAAQLDSEELRETLSCA